MCPFSLFNATPTTEIYTLSLHDALPIWQDRGGRRASRRRASRRRASRRSATPAPDAVPLPRSEEHTSELQSHSDLVCRLLLEKKKNKKTTRTRCGTNQKEHQKPNCATDH